jgi:hypothetical protein
LCFWEMSVFKLRELAQHHLKVVTNVKWGGSGCWQVFEYGTTKPNTGHGRGGTCKIGL